MIQGQFEPSGQQRFLLLRRSRLLQQHPILIPVLLLTSALALGVASFFADTLFPLMVFIGAPIALLCLAVALVLGVTGVLVSIISILESIDRSHSCTGTFSKSKGA